MSSFTGSPMILVQGRMVFRISSLAVLIVICTFGPYIHPGLGLRLEQAVIYVSFALLLITGKMSLPKSSLLLGMLLCFAILLITPMLTFFQGNYIRPSLVVAQFENYLQAPIVLMVFIAAIRRSSLKGDRELFSRLTIVIMYMLAINTFFSLYINQNPSTDLLPLFTGTRVISTPGLDITGMNISRVSAIAGRVAGVFIQVLEGGFAYSFGLFLWAFNFKGTRKRGWVAYTLLVMILIGGFLTLSKVFLVLGFPLFVLSLGIKRVLLIMFALIVCILFLLLTNLSLFEELAQMNGFKYLSRLVNLNPADFIAVYTSGRFSEGSMIMESIYNVFRVSPVIGFGFGSIETSDFSLNEVISLGGLVGLIAYVSLHSLLILLAFKLNKGRARTLFLNVLVLTILTAMSAPIITANRISVFIWLIVAWALCEVFRSSGSLERDK